MHSPTGLCPPPLPCLALASPPYTPAAPQQVGRMVGVGSGSFRGASWAPALACGPRFIVLAQALSKLRQHQEHLISLNCLLIYYPTPALSSGVFSPMSLVTRPVLDTELEFITSGWDGGLFRSGPWLPTHREPHPAYPESSVTASVSGTEQQSPKGLESPRSRRQGPHFRS